MTFLLVAVNASDEKKIVMSQLLPRELQENTHDEFKVDYDNDQGRVKPWRLA